MLRRHHQEDVRV